MGRVKALGVLLLPFLTFGVIAAALVLIIGRGGHRISTDASKPGRGSDTLSMTSTDASVDVRQVLQGATTVKVYTITPKY